MHHGLFQLFVFLAAAVVAVPLAKRLGLGSVLGYLIAGIAVGPAVFGLVGSEEGNEAMHVAEFGVVMMLFIIGLELRPALLWKMRAPILGLGGSQVVITTLAIAGIAFAAGLPGNQALAVGMILALSSTAIVLQSLAERNRLRTRPGQGAFAVLLFQDIAVIPIIAILPFLASGGAPDSGGHSGLDSLPGWAHALVVVAVVAGIVVGGHFLLRPAFRFIASTGLREIFTAAALLIVVGITLAMEAVGLSPALGTFLAGVVLAESEYRHELESAIEPFKGLLLGIFFIAVGAAIDFRLIAANPGIVAAIVLGLILVKAVVLLVLGKIFKMDLGQNLLLSIALAQGGEFGFVLFSFSTSNGILPDELAALLVASVALSMALTPLVMLLDERVIQPRFHRAPVGGRAMDAIDDGPTPVIIAGFGRFGHIIGRFLNTNGVATTVLELDSEHVEFVRKIGIKVFYGDASRLDLLHAAGAADAKLLVVAVDSPAKVLEIVDTAQKHFPNLKILARANGRAEAYDLIHRGVDHFYRETLDTSLVAGIDALRALGFRGRQAHAAARAFRRYDEDAVRELSQFQGDDETYLARARARVSSLDQVMAEDARRGFGSTDDRSFEPKPASR